jgi:hypothetical protein
VNRVRFADAMPMWGTARTNELDLGRATSGEPVLARWTRSVGFVGGQGEELVQCGARLSRFRGNWRRRDSSWPIDRVALTARPRFPAGCLLLTGYSAAEGTQLGAYASTGDVAGLTFRGGFLRSLREPYA